MNALFFLILIVLSSYFIQLDAKASDTISIFAPWGFIPMPAPVYKENGGFKDITVLSRNITIELWEGGKQDGDDIKLIINNKVILNSYTLLKTKKIIKYRLNQSKNTIKVIAINTGKIAPNTAHIKVSPGFMSKYPKFPAFQSWSLFKGQTGEIKINIKGEN